MTERLENVSDIDIVDIHAVALARHWFESQAAEFRRAQTIIIQNDTDPERIRLERELLHEDIMQSPHSKAIDALNKGLDDRKLARLTPGTDIYRQRLKNACATLLARRVAAAMAQADRREREYYVQ